MTDELHKLADDVLAKHSQILTTNGRYQDSINIGYVEAVVFAAPKLAQAWLEARAEIDRLRAIVNTILKDQEDEFTRMRAALELSQEALEGMSWIFRTYPHIPGDKCQRALEAIAELEEK